MDYLTSFFTTPQPPRLPSPPHPRLPDLHPRIPHTNTSHEILYALPSSRLVAVIVWASSTYSDLSEQQEAYDQLLQARRVCHEDFVFLKCDVDVFIREAGELGGKGGWVKGQGKGENGGGVGSAKGENEGEAETPEDKRKRGERKVRGMLGVHPKAARESGAISVFVDGELKGSIEGEEMAEYGIVEKALNSVFLR